MALADLERADLHRLVLADAVDGTHDHCATAGQLERVTDLRDTGKGM